MNTVNCLRVKPDWSIEQLRREALSIIMAYKIAIWNTLKDHPDLLDKLHEEVMKKQWEDFQKRGITTALGLAEYLAEVMVNFGAGLVSVSGDDTNASLSIEDYAGWEFVQQHLQQNEDDGLRFSAMANRVIQRFGEVAGYECNADISSDRPLIIMNFSRTQSTSAS